MTPWLNSHTRSPEPFRPTYVLLKRFTSRFLPTRHFAIPPRELVCPPRGKQCLSKLVQTRRPPFIREQWFWRLRCPVSYRAYLIRAGCRNLKQRRDDPCIAATADLHSPRNMRPHVFARLTGDALFFDLLGLSTWRD